MVELVISCLLIGTVAGLVVPSVTWTAVERRAIHQHQLACEELANLMDRLTRQAWEDVTPELAEQMGLYEEVRDQLPDAQLSATVDANQDAKRIQLSLVWSNRAGQAMAPIRLTTWIYRQTSADQMPAQEDEPQ